MPYTNNPGNIDTDTVRFLIGDTDTTQEQLTDEEIDYLISSKGSVFGAAIAACDALIAKYSRDVDVRFGPSSESNSQRVKAYQTLRAQLVTQSLTGGTALPYAGGISKSDKQSSEANTDREPPKFTRTQFDYPGDSPGALSRETDGA